MDLASALVAPDRDGPLFFATIRQVYANGTVDVDFGGGRVGTACVVQSSYSPTAGQQVVVERFNAGLWLVRGDVRTSNTTTVAVGRSIGIPYNITPVTPTGANPLVVSVAGTSSWRSADGWSGAYLPTTDTVAQGAYSTAYGYYYGCYFYGANAFVSLAGRTCTRIRIRLNRQGSGGSAGGTQQVIAPHVHPSQPADSPLFATTGVNVGALGWGSAGVFDLPVSWGQSIIDGTYSGFGHFLLAAGNGNYSLAVGKGGNGATGQITLDWA